MLMRFDPFRELDRLTQQAAGGNTRSPVMAMDAYRQGDSFIVHFDLPGVDQSSIELTIEKNVLTVTAQRAWKAREDQEVVVSERPQGTFSRQLFLGEGLDPDHITASYDAGVLTVTSPVAQQATPRRVEVTGKGGATTTIDAASSERPAEAPAG